jgi:hypothetical protein
MERILSCSLKKEKAPKLPINIIEWFFTFKISFPSEGGKWIIIVWGGRGGGPNSLTKAKGCSYLDEWFTLQLGGPMSLTWNYKCWHEIYCQTWCLLDTKDDGFKPILWHSGRETNKTLRRGQDLIHLLCLK